MGRIDATGARRDAPVLRGLDHWLQKNLANFHDGRSSRSTAARSLRRARLAGPRHRRWRSSGGMVLRGALPARQVYRAVFQAGSPAPPAMVDSFIAFAAKTAGGVAEP